MATYDTTTVQQNYTKSSMSALRRRETLWAWICVGPAVLGFLLFAIGPILASLIISFTRWPIVSAPTWVGLQNFKQMFTNDPLFWQSLKVSFGYSLGSVPLSMLFAFGLAQLLNQKIRGLPIFRTIFYLPSIVPFVASSVLFLWLFNPDFGMFNAILGFFGIPKLQWIFSSTLVVPSLILMSLWGVGGMMIIFLAGLQGVPRHLYEAVEVDGGNAWHRLRHVTIPMITPIILFNLVLSIIGAMQTFTQAYVMTQGGPDNASLFYVLYLYRTAFQEGNMGYASALAWVLFIIIMAMSLAVFKTSGRWVYYEGGER